ncbi:hypothetical protein [Aquidulcibacter sp.]|uniref:hypothetical protein n=1 Tax=Aquidulcibacter sp. TaxID=2052990 RepID=UPI0025BDF793|nr:hypothetical protein [Aquidulcibacter sp.]MCA3697713.1 hypothetical protein [Aquidulcibacter sp.]
MKNLVSMKALGLAAIGLAMLVPLSSAHADAAGQGRLVTAIQTYQSASNEGRAMAAGALRRALASNKNAPAATKAEAIFFLSDYAMRDRKKDLALKQAEEGMKLLETLQASEAPAVRALGARVKAQALLAKEERLAAFKLILDARLAYGTQKPQANAKWDTVGDALKLWEGIAYADLVGAEKKIATDLMAARKTELVRISKMEGSCDFQNNIVRIANMDSNLPAYPIAPLFAGQAGGVMMRISFDSEGRVTKAKVTSFSTSEDFAILTERAASNWVATGEGLSDPNCRTDRPTLVVFSY